MTEALDLGSAIGTVFITDGHLKHFQIKFHRAENQIKITERVEIAEIMAIGSKLIIMMLEHDLGPAQGVLKALAQKP